MRSWEVVAADAACRQPGKAGNMGDWIPFAEGRYLAERAVLIADDAASGVELADTIIEVFEGRGGRRLEGRGRARNALLVQLLDENEDLDLLLDLGGEFKYRLKQPRIQGGKVFHPGTASFIQFLPSVPWEQIPEDDFNSLVSRIRILTGERS
jgi:hypothetical protein